MKKAKKPTYPHQNFFFIWKHKPALIKQWLHQSPWLTNYTSSHLLFNTFTPIPVLYTPVLQFAYWSMLFLLHLSKNKLSTQVTSRQPWVKYILHSEMIVYWAGGKVFKDDSKEQQLLEKLRWLAAALTGTVIINK